MATQSIVDLIFHMTKANENVDEEDYDGHIQEIQRSIEKLCDDCHFTLNCHQEHDQSTTGSVTTTSSARSDADSFSTERQTELGS